MVYNIIFRWSQQSQDLMDLSSDIAEFEEQTILANCQNFVQNYESFKKRGRNGELVANLKNSGLCIWIW